MELPEELVYEMLMDWDYDEIIQYCLTNKYAATVCESPTFWGLMAHRDFKLPLSTVHTSSPREQYRIMYEIFNSPYGRFDRSVQYRQFHLINDEDWKRHGLSVETLRSLVSEMHAGNWDTYNRITKLEPKLHTYLYIQALEMGFTDVSDKIAPDVDFENFFDYLDSLELSETAWIRFIQDAVKCGHTDIPMDILEITFEDPNYLLMPGLFEYLLDNYTTPELLENEFRLFFGKPVIRFLLGKYSKEIGKWARGSN